MARPDWNHNTQYHRLILRALPTLCHRVLDVGCGTGVLTRALADRADEVIGIDRHDHSIAHAQENNAAPNVTYMLDDFLTHPFESASFDAITSVAALHHLPVREALQRMQSLLRPGGVLAMIEIAARRWPRDLPYDAAGFVVHRLQRVTKHHQHHPSPVLEPTMSYAETRALLEEELPGARYRRLVLFRYCVTWHKPLS
jgi:2-polyprenyl-3-methyl-5-hydroxy-6-metoxy-1,4-benzoquinol methylase